MFEQHEYLNRTYSAATKAPACQRVSAEHKIYYMNFPYFLKYLFSKVNRTFCSISAFVCQQLIRKRAANVSKSYRVHN